MPLFIIFVFGAVVLGAGTLLAPAWPTKQPRIALAGTLALGLVVGGAVFWAMLFGWSTLVIDYLLFALVTVIFLGGTLSHAQTRAEAKGEKLLDSDQGWPGPQDLAFFALVAVIFATPALILPVPLDTDAQGFGYLALTARMGGTFDTLAPFHPEISYLYSPGFTAITAYLSQQLGQPMQTIQLSMGAILGFLCVWLAYDFGAELRDKRLGRAMALAMLGGMGLFLAYMDSHFTTLLALLFALAFLTYAMRYLRYGYPADAIAAGLMLGATVLAHPDTTIILGLGYAPWLLTMWLGDKSEAYPTLRKWLVLVIGVPLVALIGISPWLINMRHLLGSDIVSPFGRDPNNWRVMVFYHGLVIVPIAIVGAVIGLKKRSQAALLAVGWLVLVLDFSTTGLLERLVPWLVDPVLRYDYPFSIAWHGPIIPYTILGGMGLLWLWDTVVPRPIVTFARRYVYALTGAAGVILLLVLIFNQPLLAFSKGKVSFFGAFSSQADVDAMTWIRENTPSDARILNFPGPQEGDWVPVIAERDSIYYRWQPFFRGDEASLVEQDRLRAFWEDPADPDNAGLLKAANVSYVIVPQIVGSPNRFETMWRWREPFAWELGSRSSVEEAAYLKLVFDDDGAQVYQLVDSADSP
jgi:hypothetical protein